MDKKKKKLRIFLFIALGVLLLVGGYETASAISDARYPTYSLNTNSQMTTNNNTTYVFDQVVTTAQVTLLNKIAKTSNGDPVYKIKGQDPGDWVVVNGSGYMAPYFLYRNIKISEPNYRFINK